MEAFSYLFSRVFDAALKPSDKDLFKMMQVLSVWAYGMATHRIVQKEMLAMRPLDDHATEQDFVIQEGDDIKIKAMKRFKIATLFIAAPGRTTGMLDCLSSTRPMEEFNVFLLQFSTDERTETPHHKFVLGSLLRVDLDLFDSEWHPLPGKAS